MLTGREARLFSLGSDTLSIPTTLTFKGYQTCLDIVEQTSKMYFLNLPLTGGKLGRTPHDFEIMHSCWHLIPTAAFQLALSTFLSSQSDFLA